MFEKLTTPEEIFSFKLGAALAMEQTNLEMLADLEEHANRPELKEQFAHHADETRQQISNLEKCSELLQQNLEQEQHTLDEAKTASEKVANAGIRVSA